MKYAICCVVLLTCLFSAACHKTTVPAHTDGLGGMRNWHVYNHFTVHRFITADSAVYSDSIYAMPDQSFALNVSGADTVMFHSDKYYFSHSAGNTYYFSIWHNRVSGNKSMITYNRDSNTVRINEIINSVSFNTDAWYYSY